MKNYRSLNRLKIVLAEKSRTNRWQADAIEKKEASVSRWCSNKAQPSIDVFRQVANTLDIYIKNLLKCNQVDNRSV